MSFADCKIAKTRISRGSGCASFVAAFVQQRHADRWCQPGPFAGCQWRDQRGEIRVLDRSGLEAAASNCQAADRQIYAELPG